MNLRSLAVASILGFSTFCPNASAEDTPKLFKRTQVSDQFFSEGAGFGDFNKDGKMDIVAGPFWYEGPDFQKKHQFFDDKAAGTFDPHKYSENFFAFVHDFNGDGWPDILILGFPGKDTSWYENPKGKGGPWEKHRVWYELLHGNRGLIIWDDKHQFVNNDATPGPRGQEAAPFYTELTSGIGALFINSEFRSAE